MKGRDALRDYGKKEEENAAVGVFLSPSWQISITTFQTTDVVYRDVVVIFVKRQ